MFAVLCKNLNGERFSDQNISIIQLLLDDAFVPDEKPIYLICVLFNNTLIRTGVQSHYCDLIRTVAISNYFMLFVK